MAAGWVPARRAFLLVCCVCFDAVSMWRVRAAARDTLLPLVSVRQAVAAATRLYCW
jgi:hypothetical protein